MSNVPLSASPLFPLCMPQGGSRYQEASFIFQELVTKFGPSVSLLNST